MKNEYFQHPKYESVMVCKITECKYPAIFFFDKKDLIAVKSQKWRKTDTGVIRSTKQMLHTFLLDTTRDESSIVFNSKEYVDFRRSNMKSYKRNIYDLDSNVGILKVLNHKSLDYQEILFDKNDYTLISSYVWHINPEGYAATNSDKNYRSALMSRLILGVLDLKVNDSDTSALTLVDHIDRNRYNNQKINLRLVNRKTNANNAKIKSNNTTGIEGVFITKRTSSSDSWTATWYDDDNKRKRKDYSIKKYGFDEAKAMAVAMRQEMEAKFKQKYI